MSTIDHGGPGGTIEFYHHGSKKRYWVDPHGKSFECFQALTVKSKSKFAFFGRHDGHESFMAFSTPALIRCAIDGVVDYYTAVAITLDPAVCANNSKPPSVYAGRTKVVLFGRTAEQGWHHVEIGTLLPPADAQLQEPLPPWCSHAHAAFLRILESCETAASVVDTFRKKQLEDRAAADEAAAADAKVRAAEELTTFRGIQEELVTAIKDLRTQNDELMARLKTLEDKSKKERKPLAKTAKPLTEAVMRKMVKDAVPPAVRAAVSAEFKRRDEAAESSDEDDQDEEERVGKRPRVEDEEVKYLHGLVDRLVPAPLPQQPPQSVATHQMGMMAMPPWQSPFYPTGQQFGGMVGMVAPAPNAAAPAAAYPLAAATDPELSENELTVDVIKTLLRSIAKSK